MKIRRATSSDAANIAKVHVDSWRTTYQNVLPTDFLESLSYEKRKKLWDNNLKEQQVYVAVIEGEIIGFSVGGKERTGHYKNFLGELYAIYLLENYQNQGIGGLLFNQVIKELKESNLNSMLVWVLEDNEAEHFYKAKGGKKVDTKEVNIAGQTYTELAYGWEKLPLIQ
ncbi:GNAT family N-acetyltransferase [Virgibacillus sp. MSJ-26]|uniref:GNAT family N-acetyltransferase n=1 Tax=Virgibacillus sp. MSJ-26 TaxID=2841522 RepID=UPI001C0FAB34|nr:GNAT family N-acetyltransferase [Virgibacillus sp. MSJ-26]MBU5465971.1 GNAT family N-acetyltransferase [Virgibacillus sp. MSJ-26]